MNEYHGDMSLTIPSVDAIYNTMGKFHVWMNTMGGYIPWVNEYHGYISLTIPWVDKYHGWMNTMGVGHFSFGSTSFCVILGHGQKCGWQKIDENNSRVWYQCHNRELDRIMIGKIW